MPCKSALAVFCPLIALHYSDSQPRRTSGVCHYHIIKICNEILISLCLKNEIGMFDLYTVQRWSDPVR